MSTAGSAVRAIVQTGPGVLEPREFARPPVGADDGILRVEACGICGSDVEQYRGHLRADYPVVPGHELLGVIDEIGDAAAARWGVRPGDRVAVEMFVPCRACEFCLGGDYLSCAHMLGSYGFQPPPGAPALFGGYAEYAYLHPNATLHRIDADLPLDVAVLYNPLAAGVRWARHLGGVRPGDTVVILGAGQRGLTSVIAAKAAGAGTVVITGLTRDRHKLELARQFGADHVVDVDDDDIVTALGDLTDGRMADVVLELTPMATGPVLDALKCARHGGRVVLAGLKGGRTVELDSDQIIQRGLSIVGAFGVDAPAYREAIAILESGTFPMEKLTTHRFALTDAELAIRTLAGEVAGQEAVAVSIRP